MTRQELEAWLCGDGTPVPTPAEIAAVLGVTHESIADTSLLRVAHRLAGVRFTIAVLRDVFTDDGAVRRWLRAPREEFDGLSATDLLWAGQARAVEELAMREWHRPASTALDSAPWAHVAARV
jgi:hypothetical protein